jgi:hypothetical protein
MIASVSPRRLDRQDRGSARHRTLAHNHVSPLGFRHGDLPALVFAPFAFEASSRLDGKRKFWSRPHLDTKADVWSRGEVARPDLNRHGYLIIARAMRDCQSHSR